ncbi:hypothetical protein G9A89_010204 [Geosiphon pyriformis]|nr:hypothetical protein G9A89_010204 [Geosiphon pyriformis]
MDGKTAQSIALYITGCFGFVILVQYLARRYRTFGDDDDHDSPKPRIKFVRTTSGIKIFLYEYETQSKLLPIHLFLERFNKHDFRIIKCYGGIRFMKTAKKTCKNYRKMRMLFGGTRVMTVGKEQKVVGHFSYSIWLKSGRKGVCRIRIRLEELQIGRD